MAKNIFEFMNERQLQQPSPMRPQQQQPLPQTQAPQPPPTAPQFDMAGMLAAFGPLLQQLQQGQMQQTSEAKFGRQSPMNSNASNMIQQSWGWDKPDTSGTHDAFMTPDPAARAQTIQNQQVAGVYHPPGQMIGQTPQHVIQGMNPMWNPAQGGGIEAQINPMASNPWADQNYMHMQGGRGGAPVPGAPAISDETGVRYTNPKKLRPGKSFGM